MDFAELTMDARRLWPGEAPWEHPLAIVDLDRAPDEAGPLTLPPCPVLGLGDPAHPLAAGLDAVVEPPVSLRSIVEQVSARPRAAAVVVQLLRLLPALPLEQGLVAESLAYAALQGSEDHRQWIAARRRETGGIRPSGHVVVERDGDRLTIRLDNPDAGNAIDRPMRDQLHEALSLAALDLEIGRVSLRAAGRSFSMGAELAEFGTTTDPAMAHAIRCRTLPAHVALRCADRLDAHIRGACVGAGLELAAYARRVTATPDAWFQLPELAMGILPGAGGCVSLPRRIGRQRTALMILSGRRLSARTALDWGLVDAIMDDPA
jgi:enoyl-CoA hydratase/carnithine racemase